MSGLWREETALVAAYLLGSLTFATILVRATRGIDIRTVGSGNAGGTNVLRTSGKGLALVVALLDILKGVVGVLLMKSVTYDPRWLGAAAVAAILGHVFPVFFGFRGGKGVATAVGAFAVLSAGSVAVIVAVFALVVAATRYVSLGSVTAACLLPVTMGFVFRAPEGEVLAAVAAALLLIVSHRANIGRLLSGTERRLGKKDE
ncbi:MAG TPA: glycerol-3-phosphate 1-O-acyltransferase PlsY [Thermoanaerobaculia bacterium]|nr:glycerol-3-phosphate 1-O-acyltransferase PlsY [Thermoanaerobaculia bacterium]HQR66700.1 glycerol-3-phosphate 1-O-acyltransferase PlsY [Thermoanaerobaculia bacterium]